MCSEAPSRSLGLAKDIDEETRDGPLTFDEALVYTEGLKLVTMDRPIIVDKETGDCKVGDLPAKMEIVATSSGKKNQFLDMILQHKGVIDKKFIEQCFLQQRYVDLPAPIRMNGAQVAPYMMQLFIVSVAMTLTT